MKTKWIPYMIIGLLLVVIFFLRECTPKPKPCPPPSIVTHTDTIKVPVDKPYPVPVPGEIIYVPIPSDIDTQEILKDYFAQKTYTRTLIDDSTGKLVIRDTVTQNKLKRYHLEGHLNVIEHTTTITNDITVPLRNRVFLGLQIGSNLNSMMIVPTATLLTKKDKTLYTLAYDPFSKVGYVGMQFKIILKK
jgi:hypothetical protein